MKPYDVIEHLGHCPECGATKQEQGEPVTADEKLSRMKSELTYMRGQQEHGEPVATPQEIYNKICLGLAEAGCKLSEQQKMALALLVQNTTPYVPTGRQQRTWVGLTDDEIRDAIKQSEQIATGYAGWVGEQRLIWGRAIEAKLKEKNNA